MTQIYLRYCYTVLAAMAISSSGGKILEGAIRTFPDIASYQIVINGIAGNLVSTINAEFICKSVHKLSVCTT